MNVWMAKGQKKYLKIMIFNIIILNRGFKFNNSVSWVHGCTFLFWLYKFSNQKIMNTNNF